MQLQLDIDHFGARANRRILDEAQNWRPTYAASAFDLPAWPVITAQQPDVVQLMNWCFLPEQVSGPPVKFVAQWGTYNARVEKVYGGTLYREAAERGHRCLIPVTAFYEHRTIGAHKIPYLIKPKESDFWYFGGLYHPATRTFAILTTEANDALAQVHNSAKRQPVIIPQGFDELFLHKQFDGQEELTSFCAPLPHQVMEWHPVSKLLTARGVDRNVPEVAAPADYPGLPPIVLEG